MHQVIGAIAPPVVTEQPASSVEVRDGASAGAAAAAVMIAAHAVPRGKRAAWRKWKTFPSMVASQAAQTPADPVAVSKIGRRIIIADDGDDAPLLAVTLPFSDVPSVRAAAITPPEDNASNTCCYRVYRVSLFAEQVLEQQPRQLLFMLLLQSSLRIARCMCRLLLQTISNRYRLRLIGIKWISLRSLTLWICVQSLRCQLQTL